MPTTIKINDLIEWAKQFASKPPTLGIEGYPEESVEPLLTPDMVKAINEILAKPRNCFKFPLKEYK